MAQYYTNEALVLEEYLKINNIKYSDCSEVVTKYGKRVEYDYIIKGKTYEMKPFKSYMPNILVQIGKYKNNKYVDCCIFAKKIPNRIVFVDAAYKKVFIADTKKLQDLIRCNDFERIVNKKGQVYVQVPLQSEKIKSIDTKGDK